MPDNLLTTEDYADIRGAVLDIFTDELVVEQRTLTNPNGPNGPTVTWSERNTGPGLVRDLSGFELVRAQAYHREISTEVQMAALRAVEGTDRIAATNHETEEVRYLQVLWIPKPSREFVRKAYCKEFK